MILHGHKKRVLKDIIRYFVETTDSKYDNFILALNQINGKSDSELSYTEWLAKESYKLLKHYEITIQDCIENKDVINAAINEDSSRKEGEFFTPPVWCVDGREYLKRMLGDQWGKAYVWDASCYSMDTEIFTKRGWVTYNNLLDDDLVYALNPDTLQGEFVGFHKRFRKTVNEDLVHFTGKHIDLLVTKDHKMFVSHKNTNWNQDFEFCSAFEAYNTLINGSELRIPVGSDETLPQKAYVYSFTEGNYWKLVGFCAYNDNTHIEDEVIAVDISSIRSLNYLMTLLNKVNISYTVEECKNKCSINTNDTKQVRVTIKSYRLINLIKSCNNSVLNSTTQRDFNTAYYSDFIDGVMNSRGKLSIKSRIKDCSFMSTDKKYLSAIDYIAQALGYSVKLEDVLDCENGDGDIAIATSINIASNKSRVLKSSNASLEPYSGEVWDITLNKHHVFKVRRNGKSSFCGNCGTGNLMRTANYPADKLFLSSLLKEDIEIIKTSPEYQGVEAFQLDFLNEIDWDNNNMNFSNKLPPRVKQILENNEPIVFYMNPPYKVMESNSSDVGYCYTGK